MAATARERSPGEVILALEGISLAFGGVRALTDVSFDVREHEIRAIIGPNGAGKSSMLNVINASDQCPLVMWSGNGKSGPSGNSPNP